MSSADRTQGTRPFARGLLPRNGLVLAALVGSALVAAAACQASDEQPAEGPQNSTFRGRVVWLAEALARRHGVKTVPEAAERVLALETPAGDLHPLVEDIRGRAFRRDERLRKMDIELLARLHPRAPTIQVIRVFELTKDGKFELDYWCDICAIAMFELKACDCCQGPIELRKRKVDAEGRVVE